MRKRVKASFDPKTFLAKVGEGKTITKYWKDQIVFSQGQVADAVFYIQQGEIKLTVVSEQGKEAVVAILGPGHFFGEGCLNGHPRHIATTRAMDECVITRLEKATMTATIHNKPEFSELFMSYLLTRNSRIEEDLIDQLFNSSEKRLARLLLLLANFGKEDQPQPVIPKMSQETLCAGHGAGDNGCGDGCGRAVVGVGRCWEKGRMTDDVEALRICREIADLKRQIGAVSLDPDADGFGPMTRIRPLAQQKERLVRQLAALSCRALEAQWARAFLVYEMT